MQIFAVVDFRLHILLLPLIFSVINYLYGSVYIALNCELFFI